MITEVAAFKILPWIYGRRAFKLYYQDLQEMWMPSLFWYCEEVVLGRIQLLVETKPKLKKLAEDLSPCKKKSSPRSIQGLTQTSLWGGRGWKTQCDWLYCQQMNTLLSVLTPFCCHRWTQLYCDRFGKKSFFLPLQPSSGPNKRCASCFEGHQGGRSHIGDQKTCKLGPSEMYFTPYALELD